MSTDRSIVDVDAHYADHFGELVDYIDDPIERKAFEEAARIDSSDATISMWPNLTGANRVSGSKRPDGYTASGAEDTDDILDIMDELGVDKILMLGSHMLTFGLIDGDDRRQTTWANAYCDHLLDGVVDPDRGIYMMIPVPYADPNEGAELIERVGGERAVVAACLPNAGPEPPLGHRRYDPIYEAAQKAGLPIVYHGGSGQVDNFYLSGFSTLFETHALGFLWDNMSTVTSVIGRGIPEKFPDLEFVFQECGVTWIPNMMYRLDQEYLRRHVDTAHLTKRPSEYMREFYYGTQPIEQIPNPKHMEYIFEIIDAPETLMWASDYPHVDYDKTSAITSLGFLSSEEKSRILGGNAEEVFDI